MAATRLIPMHTQKNCSIRKCLKDRTDYAKNDEKTNQGEFVSSYECDPKTVDKEFELSKSQYDLFSSSRKGDIIAYQIRQSFKPGEITPEEANQVGYETAMRWTKGRHAFIVATHVDKAHIHNHIIYNSTSLDNKRKFRNFFGSARAVARLSDLICTEHQLSVIQNPQRGGTAYSKWRGFKAQMPNRERLRMYNREGKTGQGKDPRSEGVY